LLHRVVWSKSAYVSEVLNAFIVRAVTHVDDGGISDDGHMMHFLNVDKFQQDVFALLIEAVSVSETSANFDYSTRRYIPNGSHLHIRRHENIRSYPVNFTFDHCDVAQVQGANMYTWFLFIQTFGVFLADHFL
jgi:hypothetical protein